MGGYSAHDVRRLFVLGIAGLLALSLIAGSSPRLVGDGREYLAQAINFASFHGPGIRPRDLNDIQAEMARFDPSLAGWDIRGATAADARRNRDFQHFWFYALLAAPGVWATRLLAVPPTLSFTAVNLALLGIALWVALPRIGAAGALLLFASPLVWWIDKAHTEVFTFSLLVIAFSECERRPWWSMVAVGLAATQNPPIAAVAVFVWIATVLHDRAALTDRRVVAGSVAGLAFALLHPLYTFAHHHTPSLLLTATRSGVPGFAALSAVVLDPTIGLIGNFPVFLVVVPAAAIAMAFRFRYLLFDRGIAIAAASAAVFLVAFSRTTNVHHGGTPCMSRYAVWLIPLAVPLLASMKEARSRSWRRFLRVAALTSAVASIAAFRPSVPQNSREPTALASFLWTRLPSWNNPLPEVFSETLLHVDDLWVPVATDGCEKILVGGTSEDAAWPIPCYPAPLPLMCRRDGVLCYANRNARGYQFTIAPGRSAAKPRGDEVWPSGSAAHVRRIYDSWGWPALPVAADASDVVQDATGVSVASLGSRDRFILVLRNATAAAGVRVRAARQIRGVLTDPATGRVIAAESCGAGEICTIDVPAGFPILLLAMR